MGRPNPLPGGGTHPPVEVLSGVGARPPGAVLPAGGDPPSRGGGVQLAAEVLVIDGGQQISSLQRFLIFCHWIEGNSSLWRLSTS